VTDAHLLLGHFAGAGLLGGEFVLDQSRSEQALAELATQHEQGCEAHDQDYEAAQGIVSVAATNMERALRHISVERGAILEASRSCRSVAQAGCNAVELGARCASLACLCRRSRRSFRNRSCCRRCDSRSKPHSDA